MTDPSSDLGPSPARLARRAAGALLLLLALAPLFRFLDPARTGTAGRETLSLASLQWSGGLWGAAIVALAAAAAAIVVGGRPAERIWRSFARGIEGLPGGAYALGTGLLAASLAALASLVLLRATPTLLDEMAHLLQARYLAEGLVAGPAPEPYAAWMIQNSLVAEGGWVAQYPPGHTGLLALGLRAGAPWLVGVLSVGVAVWATALAAERLLPGRRALARVGAGAVALSPLLILQGAGYMSHGPAAALVAVALLGSLRGSRTWLVLAGMAAGFLLLVRPWVALTLGPVALGGPWLLDRPGMRVLLGRAAYALVGAAPFLVGGLFYHARILGGPFTSGYELAWGAAHGPGFHVDPWGNRYGVVEAIGYTSADLAGLGTDLLGTGLPLVLVVGLFLVLVGRLEPGERILAAWALVPLATNALYWHHGYHRGPRMLTEASPGWILLAVVAFDAAVRRGRSLLPVFAGWCAIVALGWAVVIDLPSRASALTISAESLARSRVPPSLLDSTLGSGADDPGARAALVFVHGEWESRLVARLAGRGMRLDSVETALRRNGACEIESWLAGEAGASLDFTPLPGRPSGLLPVTPGPGVVTYLSRSEGLPPRCGAQLGADRLGAAELAPLLWRGDLPGIEAGAPLFVRDLGPGINQEVRARYPERTAWVLLPSPVQGGGAPTASSDGEVLLLPYEEGMRVLWGGGEG